MAASHYTWGGFKINSTGHVHGNEATVQHCGPAPQRNELRKAFEILARLVRGIDLLLVLLYLGFVDNKKTIAYHPTGALRDVE